jgi:hypothetical protein
MPRDKRENRGSQRLDKLRERVALAIAKAKKRKWLAIIIVAVIAGVVWFKFAV